MSPLYKDKKKSYQKQSSTIQTLSQINYHIAQSHTAKRTRSQENSSLPRHTSLQSTKAKSQRRRTFLTNMIP